MNEHGGTAENPTRILIIGGGVAGVTAALRLAHMRLSHVHIRLVNPNPYFEYHGALYRLVANSSPLEVCIPLRTIFAGSDVDVVIDTITGLDTDSCNAKGVSGSTYAYDYALFAIGAETDYFGISGLSEFAFEARSVSQALSLRKHIADTIERSCKSEDAEEKLRAGHMVIVGGGATGVELAGELSVYARHLCRTHGVAPSYVTVELIEAASRVIPKEDPSFSQKIERRLRDLRVNILTNRLVTSAENGKVHLRGMDIETDTVVWCAGVRAHQLYADMDIFETNAKGAVLVDAHLRAKGRTDIFVAGDGAATEHAGWAQTALYDGAFVARAIAANITGSELPEYNPRAPVSVIPVGPQWAAAHIGFLSLYGRLGWWMRRLADFRLYIAILPWIKAISAFKSGKNQHRMLQKAGIVDA